MAEAAALVFIGFLLAAALSDVATMEIPNWLSLVMAAAFPPVAFAAGLPLETIGLHLGIGMAMLIVGFVAFQFGVFGGGDAKVLAAAAVWTGLAGLPALLLGTAIAGGALAALALGVRRLAPAAETAPAFLKRLLTPGIGVPYAIAIAAGGAYALPRLPF